MAAPLRSLRWTAVAAALLLVTAPGAAGADPISKKEAEAEIVAGRLAEQARQIVALDREHRLAQDRLEQAEVAVHQAERDLALASQRQDEAKRLLVAHAQVAYAMGGSVSFVGSLAGGTPPEGVARATYMRVVTGEDRQAVGRLRAAREDLEIRTGVLRSALGRARSEAQIVADDRQALQSAMSGQQALVDKVTGELAELVRAEQVRQARLRAQSARPASPAAASAPATTPAATGPLSMDEAFACIRQLESGNNYSSPSGGAYQFLDSTWQSLGYEGAAEDHPPAVQDEAARRLQARSGWSQWTVAPMCGLFD